MHIPPGADGLKGYNQQPLFPVDTNTPIKEDLKSGREIFEIIYKFYHINNNSRFIY